MASLLKILGKSLPGDRVDASEEPTMCALCRCYQQLYSGNLPYSCLYVISGTDMLQDVYGPCFKSCPKLETWLHLPRNISIDLESWTITLVQFRPAANIMSRIWFHSTCLVRGIILRFTTQLICNIQWRGSHTFTSRICWIIIRISEGIRGFIILMSGNYVLILIVPAALRQASGRAIILKFHLLPKTGNCCPVWVFQLRNKFIPQSLLEYVYFSKFS